MEEPTPIDMLNAAWKLKEFSHRKWVEALRNLHDEAAHGIQTQQVAELRKIADGWREAVELHEDVFREIMKRINA